MQNSNEAMVKSNADLKKQLETANATLFALQEQIAKLTGDNTSSGADDTASEASSSTSQPVSTYNTRSKKEK